MVGYGIINLCRLGGLCRPNNEPTVGYAIMNLQWVM